MTRAVALKQPDMVLTFRYPNYPFSYSDWDLMASSNLVDWWVYPTNMYVLSNNGLTVTNVYSKMFFRIRTKL